ncbi:MAG TPA: aldo/keto reductase [Vicinamibacterales bacterium]|jgi:aryl-alcohol dehydrogenase-like predicted oxidoreductase/histidinol phosphatase-like enzyme/predicted kinase|nr:aldo/keto reductase [Vicinamibacterales bacterium]
MPASGDAPLIGIGCMRLSTEADRDDESAIAVLHAAFDAGVNFLDTADAYCRDATETGHNERLIARAIASWSGDASRIVVATKGGLTRPDGRWVADGRARHLAAACEASLRALGVDRLPLYQLHAPDPRGSLSTSVRALAALQRDRLIDAIGLCNVTVGQLEEAMRIAPIATVQVELSLWNDDNILSGVAEYCIANGIRLLAYRPLGGPKQRRRVASDPILNDVAARHGGTPFEIAIAALRDLSPVIVPLPGPTRVETAQSASRACRISLAAEDRARLDERFAAARALRFRERSRAHPAPAGDGEIVMIMGLPGAGKSTVAESLVARGYERLNRDEAGGSLRALLPAIASGSSRLVLDNTYVTRKARAAVIQAAWQRQLPVRCIWLMTSLEDAQLNAASRIVSRYGRLLSPDELRETAKHDTAAFAPTAQFRYQRELEPPDSSEGFAHLEVMPFERRLDPSLINRAVIVWCDGVLWRSRSGRRTPSSPDDVEVVPGRAEMMRRYESDGWHVLGMSWQPEIADETLDPAAVDTAIARLRELLGIAIEVEYCPHAAGPPVCWCRKPLPGLGVVFVQRYKLDPSQCIYVGAGPQDPGFARRLGFQYRDAADFFADHQQP